MTKEISEKQKAQLKRLNSMPRTKEWIDNMSLAHMGPRPNWKYKYNSGKESRDARRVKRTFGITIEEYNQIINRQKECQICGSTKSIGLDHCHKTMKVRGMLCHCCNVGLGFFKEDISLMKKAIAYLQHFSK